MLEDFLFLKINYLARQALIKTTISPIMAIISITNPLILFPITFPKLISKVSITKLVKKTIDARFHKNLQGYTIIQTIAEITNTMIANIAII